MQTLIESGGKQIRLQAVEPAGERLHPAILLLHGAGGNAGLWFDRLAPLLAGTGAAFYAVHYFDRTGTVRADPQTIGDGVHVPLWLETIGDALRSICGRPGVDPGRVAVVGISLGAFLGLAAATRPEVSGGMPPLRAVVDVSGGLVSPYAERATEAFPPTLILHGAADTTVPVSFARALDALLTRLKVAHETQILPGEGHWFSAGAQLRIVGALATFLGRHLQARG